MLRPDSLSAATDQTDGYQPTNDEINLATGMNSQYTTNSGGGEDDDPLVGSQDNATPKAKSTFDYAGGVLNQQVGINH